MCAPFLEEIHIEKYLKAKQLEQFICGGENYEGVRPCHYKLLYNKNTCVTCGGRQTCNGCSNCEKCKDVLLITKEELEELEELEKRV